MKIHRLLRIVWIVGVIAFLTGCATISPFSQKAYEQAISLKVESLAIMDKAKEPYSNHLQEVDTLKLNVEKAYEYAKGLPKNEDTTSQLAIIKDPTRNSLGGFLERWEKSQKLNKEFILEAKKIVSDGFDMVIELESGKRKPNDGQSQ